MAQIKLSAAVSLDGYLAKNDDSIDWLENFPNPDKESYGMEEFMAGIDVVVMGKRTYEQVLSFDCDWPYPNCRLFVFTRDVNYVVKTPDGQVLNSVDEAAIAKIRAASKKSAWIVGGGNLAKDFLEKRAVDEITMTIIPVMLGAGIRLFQEQQKPVEQLFDLVKAEPFKSGVVNLIYKRKDAQL